jgi:hypothetical protein
MPASGFPNIVGATDGISPVVTLATWINEGCSNSPSSDDTWSCSDAMLAPEDSAMKPLWNGYGQRNLGRRSEAAAGSWWALGTPQRWPIFRAQGGQTQTHVLKITGASPQINSTFDSYLHSTFSSHIRTE